MARRPKGGRALVHRARRRALRTRQPTRGLRPLLVAAEVKVVEEIDVEELQGQGAAEIVVPQVERHQVPPLLGGGGNSFGRGLGGGGDKHWFEAPEVGGGGAGGRPEARSVAAEAAAARDSCPRPLASARLRPRAQWPCPLFSCKPSLRLSQIRNAPGPTHAPKEATAAALRTFVAGGLPVSALWPRSSVTSSRQPTMLAAGPRSLLLRRFTDRSALPGAQRPAGMVPVRAFD
jgi:hypothetical protein